MQIKSPSTTTTQYDSSTEQTYQSDIDDYDKNLTFIPKLNQKDRSIKRPIIQPSNSLTSSLDPEKDLITFPSLASPLKSDTSNLDLNQFKRKKCGFEFKKRQCYTKDCKKRNVLSKLVCKCYNKLRSKLSEPTLTDQSAVCNYSIVKKKIGNFN